MQIPAAAASNTLPKRRATPDSFAAARQWKQKKKTVVPGKIDTGNANTDRSTTTGWNAFMEFTLENYPQHTSPWIDWTDIEIAKVVAAFAEQMVTKTGKEYKVGSIKTYMLSIQRTFNEIRHAEMMKGEGYVFKKVPYRGTRSYQY
jgi:hypothetical protein